MEQFIFARCLFCVTGSEQSVVDEVNYRHLGKALFPKRTKRVLKNHIWTIVETGLMPGYVFVYTNDEKVNRYDYVRIKNVKRVLTYQADVDTLLGSDLQFAKLLWQTDGKLSALQAVQEGDKVRIVDSIFQKLHGRITKMDRRRKTVRVELEMTGHIQKIWLNYEFVEPNDLSMLPDKITLSEQNNNTLVD